MYAVSGETLSMMGTRMFRLVVTSVSGTVETAKKLKF